MRRMVLASSFEDDGAAVSYARLHSVLKGLLEDPNVVTGDFGPVTEDQLRERVQAAGALLDEWEQSALPVAFLRCCFQAAHHCTVAYVPGVRIPRHHALLGQFPSRIFQLAVAAAASRQAAVLRRGEPAWTVRSRRPHEIFGCEICPAPGHSSATKFDSREPGWKLGQTHRGDL